MTHVVVLGSGIVGTAAAWDLTRRGHIVTVADASSEAADHAATIAGATAATISADDLESVGALLKDTDLVVSGLPYRYGVDVARTAIECGTHYLDFGGNPTIVGQQIRFDADARSAGVTVVPDCGLAPGMANVLASGAIESLGGTGIEELRIRVGALPATPTGALGYQLAFNPAGLINEYAEPCEVIVDGEYATVEPLTGLEEITWEPFGRLEAFHTAGGSSTLPRRMAGHITTLDYKTLRYPGHAGPFRAMLELGLFDETPQTQSGASPRAVLLEALAEHLPSGSDDLVLVRVWGRTASTTVGYQVVDRNDDQFSALARTTAFPATALGHLILTGTIDPGVRAMDAAFPAAGMIELLAEVGIAIDAYAPA